MKAWDLMGALVLEDGRRWAEAAHDFQVERARAWQQAAEPMHFDTDSRGSAKTTDLAGTATAVMATADRPLRCYWLAADADQGALAIDTMAGFVQRTPGLADQLDVQARKVIAPATGATLEVLPADAAGTWGLTPHWVFVDELANWNDGPSARRLWDAASSAVAKRSDARLIVITTPSSPDHFAFKILEHARRNDLWRVCERRGPAPWLDPVRLEEQRQRLPAAVYAQLFEGEWTAAEGSFLDPALVEAAFTLDGPALDRQAGVPWYVAGLDLGVRHDRTVFAIGHREGDRVLLDRMQTWKGSRLRPVDFGEVEDFIVQAHKRFRFALRLDPWQGLDLAQRLRARGIRADEFTFTAASKQRLAASLLSTVNSGNLALYEAEGLRDELLGLRLVQTSSGGWAFDHRSGGHDDRAVALALMTVAALERLGGVGTMATASDIRLPVRSGPSGLLGGLSAAAQVIDKKLRERGGQGIVLPPGPEPAWVRAARAGVPRRPPGSGWVEGNHPGHWVRKPK